MMFIVQICVNIHYYYRLMNCELFNGFNTNNTNYHFKARNKLTKRKIQCCVWAFSYTSNCSFGNHYSVFVFTLQFSWLERSRLRSKLPKNYCYAMFSLIYVVCARKGNNIVKNDIFTKTCSVFVYR